MPRVFLITGTSTGFGADYVNHVLSKGDYAVATARDPSKLSFAGATDKNFLSTRLDVTDNESITEAFEKAHRKFGRVDVVVNNAGYGLAGCFEELTEEQIRKQMDVNFFGLVCWSQCMLLHADEVIRSMSHESRWNSCGHSHRPVGLSNRSLRSAANEGE